MKKCIKCLIEKDETDFYSHPKMKKRAFNKCKECCKKEAKIRRTETVSGLVSDMYNKLKQRSNKKGFGCLGFTRQEFVKWLTEETDFNYIYEKWYLNNYHKHFRPSVDRKDDLLNYTFSNMQLVTWLENVNKSYEQRRKGEDSRNSISVGQYDLSGKLLKNYHSISEASRISSINKSSIIRCCKGKSKTAGNYLWKYNN